MIGDRRSLRARDYMLAVEAAACLLSARVRLVAVPFRRIAERTTRAVRGGSPGRHARERAIADVRWAIAAAAARLPGMACFPRALAAQAMLRRRGVPSTLVYGARRRADQLDAHVWVTAANDIVAGGDVAREYSAVVTYSNDAPNQP